MCPNLNAGRPDNFNRYVKKVGHAKPFQKKSIPDGGTGGLRWNPSVTSNVINYFKKTTLEKS